MNQSLAALSVDLLPRRVTAARPLRTFIAGLALGAFLGVGAVASGPLIATTFSEASTPAATGSSTAEYRSMYENRPGTGPDTSLSGSSTDEYRAMYENR
jgi:hypothetical protein